MPAFLGVWLAPVFIAMIYDYLYVIGIVALIVIGFRGLLGGGRLDEYRQEPVEAGELTEFAGFPSVPIPA